MKENGKLATFIKNNCGIPPQTVDSLTTPL